MTENHVTITGSEEETDENKTETDENKTIFFKSEHI